MTTPYRSDPPGASAADAEVAVLVPAAGMGQRMGGVTRKQFRKLGGQTLLVRTLEVFEESDAVGHVVVAAPPEDVRSVSDRLQAARLRKLTAVVEGGATRQASVRRALRAVPATIDIVLVHDAVRPFIRPAQVDALVHAVRTHGAASLAVPVSDTLRRGKGERFADTVDRKGLYRMQTPQGFRRAWLEAAHRAAREERVEATDDVELVQHLGHDVWRVPGSTLNVKITTPTDWTFATAIWPEWQDGTIEMQPNAG